MSAHIAQSLLETKAVHLSPDNPFTWTSGIISPIYCDNRQLISYPEHRTKIVQDFVKVIQEHFSQVEVIAGTATAGIPWAALIADKLDLPLIYIRGSAKKHGLKNCLEGHYKEGQKVLIIEDLISTGKSSIHAANEVTKEGLNCLGVASIFTYDFDLSHQNFAEYQTKTVSLAKLQDVLDYANTHELLTKESIQKIQEWRKNFNS